jgi:hypothetical protein
MKAFALAVALFSLSASAQSLLSPANVHPLLSLAEVSRPEFFCSTVLDPELSEGFYTFCDLQQDIVTDTPITVWIGGPYTLDGHGHTITSSPGYIGPLLEIHASNGQIRNFTLVYTGKLTSSLSLDCPPSRDIMGYIDAAY